MIVKCPFHIVGDIFMVENKYTSSKGEMDQIVNHFTSHIQVKSSKGPNIDICGTLTFKFTYEEHLTFKTTLSFRAFRSHEAKGINICFTLF